ALLLDSRDVVKGRQRAALGSIAAQNRGAVDAERTVPFIILLQRQPYAGLQRPIRKRDLPRIFIRPVLAARKGPLELGCLHPLQFRSAFTNRGGERIV